MSLQAHALAICAAGALNAIVPAWVSVALEPHDPLALAEERGKVLVAVFIGDERADIKGRRWTTADTVIELVVQVILPPVVVAEVGGAVCEFDTGKGGARPIYALVHEALRWVFNSPASGVWGTLLQDVFVSHPEPVTGMPGRAERPSKPPMPMLDYAIPCSVIAPPVLGEPAPYPWPDIVAAMRADGAFTPEEAGYFEALIGGRPLQEWEADLALAGLSVRAGEALGHGTVAGIGATPAATRLTIGTPRGELVVEGAGDE